MPDQLEHGCGAGGSPMSLLRLRVALTRMRPPPPASAEQSPSRLRELLFPDSGSSRAGAHCWQHHPRPVRSRHPRSRNLRRSRSSGPACTRTRPQDATSGGTCLGHHRADLGRHHHRQSPQSSRSPDAWPAGVRRRPVGLLSFAVAAPMAVAAHYSYVTASSVGAVFKSENETKSATRPTLEATQTAPGESNQQDPWAGKPRLNVLLLGGDAGPGRVGTRTDTVILASINTKTGDTALISLPRNTARMPFPSRSPLHKYYPYGFTNGNGENAEYFLNAMYRNVPRSVPKDVLGPTDNLGADVLKLSVGEATGLRVDYYVLINLEGFSKMINALGGIKLNINTYIPIGGDTDRHIPPKEYLKPGPNQKLDGRGALWYARGRYGSDDFARMDRQRCVINAIIKQANPTNMLARYEDIVKAGKQLVYTDMPREVLPLMVDLSLRVKDGNVRSVVFKSGVDGFSSANPNYSLMHKRVKAAISESKHPKATKKSGVKPQSESVNDACAYDPKVAATARPYR